MGTAGLVDGVVVVGAGDAVEGVVVVVGVAVVILVVVMGIGVGEAGGIGGLETASDGYTSTRHTALLGTEGVLSFAKCSLLIKRKDHRKQNQSTSL